MSDLFSGSDAQERRQREQSIKLLRTDIGEFMDYVLDETTTDLCFNDDGAVWALTGSPRTWVHAGTATPQRVDSLVTLAAASAGKICNAANPFQAAMVPLSEKGAVRAQLTWKTVSPEDRSAATFRRNIIGAVSLDLLMQRGMMTAAQAAAIRYILLVARKNFLISGEPGSGKSTILSATLAELKSDPARLLVLEDEAELLPQSPNRRRLLATYSGERLVTWHELMVAMKREKPERLAVGEVREGLVAREIMKILNSGVAGSGLTIHADSAEMAYIKYRELHEEEAPVADARIAETFPYVVHASNLRVQGVYKVETARDGRFELCEFFAPLAA